MLFSNHRDYNYREEPKFERFDKDESDAYWRKLEMIKRMNALHVKAKKARRIKIKITRKSKKMNRK